MTNISRSSTLEENMAEFFRVIGQPARIQILMVIGKNEACVCHLEAYLGQRQAAISQHLMVLRDAGLVTTHRDRRNIYYRLARPEILELINQTASILGITREELEKFRNLPLTPCPCPHCNPEKAEGLDCSKVNVFSKQ